MAYSTSNPPALLAQAIGGGSQLWGYRTTDAGTAVDAAGYFTNGQDLGMVAGAGMMLADTDASPVAGAFVVVNAVSASGTDVTDGTAQTDSD